MIAAPGLILSENRNKNTVWTNAGPLEIEEIVSTLSIDEFILKSKIITEFQEQMRLHLKDLIREHVKLDVILWKNAESGSELTAQVVVDGEVVQEKTVQVA